MLEEKWADFLRAEAVKEAVTNWTEAFPEEVYSQHGFVFRKVVAFKCVPVRVRALVRTADELEVVHDSRSRIQHVDYFRQSSRRRVHVSNATRGADEDYCVHRGDSMAGG